MIGDTIKVKRKKAKLTQKQLALQLGVSAAIIGHWERGETEIPSEYIIPLCQVFRCSPTAFINYDRHSFEWYAAQFKENIGGLEDFALANPDLMEMILWMVNVWDGDFAALVLMAFYYCLLDKHERCHMSYFVGMTFRSKYEHSEQHDALMELAHSHIDYYIEEWRKLAKNE